MTVNDLVLSGDLKSVYVLARYFYRIGEPIMQDALYDQLELRLKAESASEDEGSKELAEYFARTYDDDTVPHDLLKKIGREDCVVETATRSELFTSMNEDKSQSIKSVTEYDAAWPFFRFAKDNKLDLMTSLKMDGDNTKMLYVDGKYTLAMSRGRDGNSFDFTETVKNVMPATISSSQKELRVYGESYVVESALEQLRQKYDSEKYKTCKSAAISMLRVKHDTADYQFLKTRVFLAEGLADNLDDMFTALEVQGVETAPHKKIKWESIPDKQEDFEPWLKREVMDHFWRVGAGIPSDGVVAEINDLLWDDVVTNQYSNRRLALKFDHWGFRYTKGVIRDILIEQRRVFKSVRVTIDPVVQYDGCTATTINTFDLAVLIDNDLCIGKEIWFEKNSGAVNILIHGDRLVKLTSSEQSCV